MLKMIRTAALFLTVLGLPLSATPGAGAGAAIDALPATMLWAWERKEDFRWVPRDVGIAYVAATLELASAHAGVRYRAYPLLVRPDTTLVPVIHVDASWRKPPLLNQVQRAAIVDHVIKAARSSPSRVVQLDFEVRRSQRAFLLDVVRDIRRRLPPGVALSATALASWCAGDYWVGALAADEIVPMAFRMARDDAPIRALLAADGGFVRPRCRTSLGMATDEPAIATQQRRRYFFSPRPWDQETWRRVQ